MEVTARAQAVVAPVAGDPGLVLDPAALFGRFQDLVLVVGRDRRVTYANPVARPVLGWDPEALVGRLMTELLHPDDRGRALEAGDRLDRPEVGRGVAGAYRLRHADGSWCPLDLSVGLLGEEPTASVVIVGRVNHDLALHTRILGCLTSGEPLERAVELVPSFGTWRHPGLPFAVGYDGPGLARQLVGSPVAVELLRGLVELAPWTRPGASSGEPLHGQAHELPGHARALAAAEGLSGWVVVPVRAADGETGALAAGWTAPGRPGTRALANSVRRMAAAMDLVFQWHQQRVERDRAAATDPLTGVANRPWVLGELAEVLGRSRSPVAVVLFDLDGLQAVNDADGLAAGDARLVALVDRLRDRLRPGDRIGRVGGDEVLVVCRGDAARAAAELLATSCGAPIDGTTVSAGIVVTDGPGGERGSVDDLLAQAEGALCVAKAAGGGRHVVTSSPGGLDRRELGLR